MAKEIHYLDDDHNPLTVPSADDCKVFMSNISQGFDLDLSDIDGNTVEYEVVIADGGPHMRPKIAR
jgi:hypothetical protein